MHVFAVNPYGGPPDVRSHLEARVGNVELVVRSFSEFFWTTLHILYFLSLIRDFDIVEGAGSNSKPQDFFSPWAAECPVRFYPYCAVRHHLFA